MNTNGQTFWNNFPAAAKRLGGVGRVHSDYLCTSFFRFVLKHMSEQAKPRIVRGERQVAIAVHKAERKIFNRNQVVIRNEAAANFVKIVSPLVRNLFMQSGNVRIRFSLALTAFDLSGSVTLKAAQLCEAFTQPAGIVNQFPSSQGGKTFQSHIYPNLLLGWDTLLFYVGKIQHQTGIPTVVDLLDDNVLDRCSVWDCPMIANPHISHVLDVKAHAPVFVLPQLAPVPVGVFQALETTASLETGEAWLFSRLQTAKESREGFVQTAEKVLEARSIQSAKGIGVFTTQVSELCPLRPVANPLARFLICHYPLFEGSIVNQSGPPQQKVQPFRLFSILAKEVFVRAEHTLARLLNLDVPLHGFFGYVTHRANGNPSDQQARHVRTQVRVKLAQYPRGISLGLVGKALESFGWVALDKQLNVIRYDFKCLNRYVQLLRFLIQQGAQLIRKFTNQHFAPIFRTPNHVIIQRINAARIAPIARVIYRTSVL